MPAHSTDQLDQAACEAARTLLAMSHLTSEAAVERLQAIGIQITVAEVQHIIDTAEAPTVVDESEWRESEHIAEPVLIDAQKLVAATGSVELAKKAVETVGRRCVETPAATHDAAPHEAVSHEASHEL